MIFSTVAPEIQSSNFDPTFLSKGDALKLKLLGYKQNEDASFERTGLGKVGHGINQAMSYINPLANLVDWADEKAAAGIIGNVDEDAAARMKKDANRELGRDMLHSAETALMVGATIATGGGALAGAAGSGVLSSLGLTATQAGLIADGATALAAGAKEAAKPEATYGEPVIDNYGQKAVNGLASKLMGGVERKVSSNKQLNLAINGIEPLAAKALQSQSDIPEVVPAMTSVVPPFVNYKSAVDIWAGGNFALADMAPYAGYGKSYEAAIKSGEIDQNTPPHEFYFGDNGMFASQYQKDDRRGSSAEIPYWGTKKWADEFAGYLAWPSQMPGPEPTVGSFANYIYGPGGSHYEGDVVDRFKKMYPRSMFGDGYGGLMKSAADYNKTPLDKSIIYYR